MYGGKPWTDGLVPVESALGRHQDPELTLDFPPDRQWVGLGLNPETTTVMDPTGRPQHLADGRAMPELV